MYIPIIHQTVTVSSNIICSQVHVEIDHSLAHLKDLLAKVGINTFRYARKFFLSTRTLLYVFELTVTGWWIICTITLELKSACT